MNQHTTPFLREVASRLIAAAGDDIQEMYLIVPSRRAVAFLREALATAAGKPIWAPRMLAMQDFLRQLHGQQFPEPLTLVAELYQAYGQCLLAHGRIPEAFERFFPWGELLLRDFDEADRYLADPLKLFANVRDLRQIDDTFGIPEESLLALRDFWGILLSRTTDEDENSPQERFLRAWEVLSDLYTAFQQRLRAKNLAYDGMAYRALANAALAGSLQLPCKKIALIGFNALSKAEEVLFEYWLSTGQAEAWWDADEAMLRPVTSPADPANLYAASGQFVRDYLRRWQAFENHAIRTDYLGLTGPAPAKELHIVEAPGRLAQTLFAGQTVDTQSDLRNTALILGDEGLLFPMLYALPDNLDSLNVTMGYPLRHTPVFALLSLVGDLIRKTDDDRLPYTLVQALLEHPYASPGSPAVLQLLSKIRKENLVLLPAELLAAPELPVLVQLIAGLPRDGGQPVFDWFDSFFAQLMAGNTTRNQLEAEHVLSAFTHYQQLRGVLSQVGSSLSAQGFARLLRETFRAQTLPFEGEPLVGLQVMGFLESRTLDFDTLCVLSCNEGILPTERASNSFVPLVLRTAFGLPTPETIDAIYAYHFHRLLFRARRMYLVYDSSQQEGGKAGEKSRYIRQMEFFLSGLPHISLHHTVLAPKQSIPSQTEIKVPHSEELRQQLLRRFGDPKQPKGFLSATSMGAYISCSLKFYFTYLQKLKAEEEVEEAMEADTVGQLLHETLEMLYLPYVGKEISAKEIELIIKNKLIESLQKNVERKLIAETGRNKLKIKLIEGMCRKVLQTDRQRAPFVVSGVELADQRLEVFTPAGRLYLNGSFDRVEVRDGLHRIVDFKTGSNTAKAFSLVFPSARKKGEDGEPVGPDIAAAFSDPHAKEALQGLIYAWLYRNAFGQIPEVAFYTVRNMARVPIIPPDVLTDELLETFEQHLIALATDILTKDFTQTADTDRCKTCDFISICKR